MDPAFKRIMGMVLVLVLLTLGVLYVFDNRVGEEKVHSSIDDIAYVIEGIDEFGVNISIQFGITIENYGTLRDVETPCSNIQSYLDIKNSTVPVETYNSGVFAEDTSYILNSTHTETSCEGEPTTYRISENVINNIVVVVPFHLNTGTYSFIWIHSFADVYDAAVINVNVAQGDNGISTIVEEPRQD